MASFPLNKEQLEFIKKSKCRLLEFYTDPWVRLNLDSSLVCIKDLLNLASDPEYEKDIPIIQSLLAKIKIQESN